MREPTQRTRNIIANILVGMSILLIVAFLAQHFMTSSRPSWHKDLVWLGLASTTASELVRGRRRPRYAAPDRGIRDL